MTCIVAHADGWMVADRRVVSNETLRNHYDVLKITKRPGLLIGTSGPHILLDLVREAVADLSGAAAFHAAVVAVREQPGEPGHRGHALAVTEHGVFEICSRGSASKVAWPFWASGSGYMAALGYLRGGYRDRGITIRPEHAVMAIECAAELDTMVGDGTQIEYLEVPQ